MTDNALYVLLACSRTAYSVAELSSDIGITVSQTRSAVTSLTRRDFLSYCVVDDVQNFYTTVEGLEYLADLHNRLTTWAQIQDND